MNSTNFQDLQLNGTARKTTGFNRRTQVIRLTDDLNQALLNTELIQNGDAETGNTTGWISTGVETALVTPGQFGGLVFPEQLGLENYVFWGGFGDASSQTLTQSIDVSSLASRIDAGAIKYKFSTLLMSIVSESRGVCDCVEGSISFLARNGTQLNSVSFFDTDTRDYDSVPLEESLTWDRFTANNRLPYGTRTISIAFNMSRENTGISTDAYVDNVSLILNELPTPDVSSIRIADSRIVEGDRGTTNAVFNVQLSKPSNQRVTVSYATANGSATSTDFTSKRGTVTFNPNQTRQTIVIPVKGDTLFERDETFSVRLSNARNANIRDANATGMIRNDDLPLPKLSINDVSLFEGNTGTNTATFTVTLIGKTKNPVSVLYNTANGTARTGSDFTPKAGRLTFRSSNRPRQSQTITIPVKGDRIFERNETFGVNLSSATNAEIRDGRGTGTIRNDDDRLTRSFVNFGDSLNPIDSAVAYINNYLGSSTFNLAESFEPSNFASGLINVEAFMG